MRQYNFQSVAQYVHLCHLFSRVGPPQESLWNRRDGEVILSLTRLLEGGLLRLQTMDATAAGKLLPRAVHTLVPQLAAEQDGVRFGVSQARLACCLCFGAAFVPCLPSYTELSAAPEKLFDGTSLLLWCVFGLWQTE